MWLEFDNPFPTGEIDAFGDVVYQFGIKIEPFANDFDEPLENTITITEAEYIQKFGGSVEKIKALIESCLLKKQEV